MRAYKLKPSVTTAQLRSALREGRLHDIPGLAVPDGIVPVDGTR